MCDRECGIRAECGECPTLQHAVLEAMRKLGKRHGNTRNPATLPRICTVPTCGRIFHSVEPRKKCWSCGDKVRRIQREAKKRETAT